MLTLCCQPYIIIEYCSLCGWVSIGKILVLWAVIRLASITKSAGDMHYEENCSILRSYVIAKNDIVILNHSWAFTKL